MLGGWTPSQQDNAMSIDATQLPAWVQEVTVLAVAIVSVATAIWRYLKTQVKPSPASTSKKSEETDHKLVREIKMLADIIEASDDEYARLTNRMLRSNQELRESIEELTQEIRAYNRKRNINATK